MSSAQDSDAKPTPRHLCSGFGERFKEVREARRLTQAVVAKACGVSQVAVSRWEAETDMPGETIVMTLAHLYVVEMEQLGWRHWAPINIPTLRPAGDLPGTVMPEAHFARLQEQEVKRQKEKAEKRAAGIAKRVQEAASRRERIAEQKLKKAERAKKLWFNTPYYRAKQEEERRRCQEGQQRLATMTPDERADYEWFEAHKKMMRALRMGG